MTTIHQRNRNPGAVDNTGMPLPSTISGLVAWYKSNTLGFANNDPVTSWEDNSLNYLTMTGLAGKIPVFITNQINGYPVVRFANKVMTIAAGRNENLCTWFMFCNFISNANHAMLLNATGDNFMWLQYASTWYCANSISDTVDQDNGNYHLWCGTLSATKVHRYLSGVDQGEQTAGATASFGWKGIGNNAYTNNVDIAEFIVYGKLLSETERINVELYMRSKYGTW